ncbi:MAG: hypothetical protein K2X01_11355 [Cyanobacteria bacterium]|nr:hypothetical protein [Cyanobacteriota bacterium]
MNTKQKIEIYSCACPVCDETVEEIKQLVSCPSCDVTVLDTCQPDIAAKAKEHGIKCLPAIVVNGKLSDCCKCGCTDETALRNAGVCVA